MALKILPRLRPLLGMRYHNKAIGRKKHPTLARRASEGCATEGCVGRPGASLALRVSLSRIIHRQVAKDAKLLLDLILNKTHGKQCVRKMIQTRSDATFSVLKPYDLCSLGVLAVHE